MSIPVRSIGEPLARDLQTSRVLARSDSTLQLETRAGALWAITTRINPAAMRVIVPTLPAWSDGATVYARDGRILADDVELTWDSSSRFDPVPRRRALSTAQRVSAARTLAGELARHPLPDALGFWDELGEMWVPLSLGLGGRAESTSGGLVARLVGCGPGLTPSGDDFLQAVLVTLSSGDEQDRAAFERVKRAVMPNLVRTTRLSHAFLEEALRGWAFGALKDVLDELPLATQDKIDALLSIGATSGPAYAFGVLMGLSYRHCEEGFGPTWQSPR